MRGFEFVLSKSDLKLSQLFAGIDLTDMQFHVFDEMVYYDQYKIDGGEKYIKNLLQTHEGNDNMWILQMVLQVFPQSITIEAIENYDDFQRSRCQLLVLVYDRCYVEIYSKNETWTQKLIDNAKKMPLDNFYIKTNTSDTRTCMWV